MMLAADNVGLRLGGVEVLRGISASLRRGTVTAICGPNGAGKSTLLACLAGLRKPDSGTVEIGAVPLADLPPRERAQRIGYLPQHGEVAWDLSVANLVALGRLPHRDAGTAAIADAIARCGLQDLAARAVSTLSGGERARALLARIFAGEPRWILADEPFAALDLGHQLGLLARLREVAKERVGVVMVLHDLALAMNHADRVLVLDRGTLAADGPPESALGEETLSRIWGIEARWLGEAGRRALAI